MALNLAPFSRWTLRDKAAQRRLAQRWASAATMKINSSRSASIAALLPPSAAAGNVLAPAAAGHDASARLTTRALQSGTATAARHLSVGSSRVPPRRVGRRKNANVIASNEAPSNTTLNGAPFGRWTLRDKAAQRPLAPRWASKHGELNGL